MAETIMADAKGHPSPPISPKVFRDTFALLRRYAQSPPSFTINLHPHSFTFSHHDGIFLYNSPMTYILDCISNETIPPDMVDVFNDAHCRYYEGCLIVEVRDFRRKEPEVKRVVLWPAADCLRIDLCLMNERYGNNALQVDDVLSMEGKFLAATEPVCLNPSYLVSEITHEVNRMQDGGKWAKSQAMKREERQKRKLTRHQAGKSEQYLKTMLQRVVEDPLPASRSNANGQFQPTFGRIAFICNWRNRHRIVDMEPIASLDAKQNATEKRNKRGRDNFIVVEGGKKLAFTLRFERGPEKQRIHTLLNIYQINSGSTNVYEGLLRWGTIFDTAKDGGSLKFHIGTDSIMILFLTNFMTFFGLDNRLVSETNSGIAPHHLPMGMPPNSFMQTRMNPAAGVATGTTVRAPPNMVGIPMQAHHRAMSTGLPTIPRAGTMTPVMAPSQAPPAVQAIAASLQSGVMAAAAQASPVLKAQQQGQQPQRGSPMTQPGMVPAGQPAMTNMQAMQRAIMAAQFLNKQQQQTNQMRDIQALNQKIHHIRTSARNEQELHQLLSTLTDKDRMLIKQQTMQTQQQLQIDQRRIEERASMTAQALGQNMVTIQTANGPRLQSRAHPPSGAGILDANSMAAAPGMSPQATQSAMYNAEQNKNLQRQLQQLTAMAAAAAANRASVPNPGNALQQPMGPGWTTTAQQMLAAQQQNQLKAVLQKRNAAAMQAAAAASNARPQRNK